LASAQPTPEPSPSLNPNPYIPYSVLQTGQDFLTNDSISFGGGSFTTGRVQAEKNALEKAKSRLRIEIESLPLGVGYTVGSIMSHVPSAGQKLQEVFNNLSDKGFTWEKKYDDTGLLYGEEVTIEVTAYVQQFVRDLLKDFQEVMAKPPAASPSPSPTASNTAQSSAPPSSSPNTTIPDNLTVIGQGTSTNVNESLIRRRSAANIEALRDGVRQMREKLYSLIVNNVITIGEIVADNPAAKEKIDKLLNSYQRGEDSFSVSTSTSTITMTVSGISSVITAIADEWVASGKSPPVNPSGTPALIGDFRVELNGVGEVMGTWSADNSSLSYEIEERYTVPDGTTKTNTFYVPKNTFKDYQAKPSGSYSYRVRGINGANLPGPYSDRVTIER